MAKADISKVIPSLARQALKEIFGLLEKHQPPWYLRKHYNAIQNGLE